MFFDSTTQVYNFTVENCHNYFVGSTAVLVHNEHSGLLGKIKKSYQTLADEIEKLLPDEAAKLANYIANKSKQTDFLGYLNTNTAKVKELVDRIKKAKVYQTAKDLVDDITPDNKRSVIKQIRQAIESKAIAQKYFNLYKNTFDSKYVNDFEKWYKEVFQNGLGDNPPAFNAHHIIPIGKLKDTKELQELLLWASQNGRLADLDFNNIDNGLMIQRKIKDLDVNGHANHPEYDKAIKSKIISIINGANGNDALAFDNVLKLISDVKKKLEVEVVLGTSNVNDITSF